MRKIILTANSYKLISNIFFLALVQLTNFALPLVTFPHIIRTVGAEKFGIISFSLSLTTYLVVVTDYGFGLSATKSVAKNRDNKQYLSKLFSEVLFTRVLILFVLISLLLLVVNFVPFFKNEASLFYYSIVYLIGNVMLPTWYFQGQEKMRYIALFNLFSKVIATLLIFYYVNNITSYYLVIGIYGFSNLIVGVFAIIFTVIVMKVNISLPSLNSILNQFKEGWYYFSNNIAAITFNGTTVLFLSFFVTARELGEYSVAEKISFSIWQILVVFTQAIYPQLCSLSLQPHHKFVSYLWKATLVLAVVICFVCAGVYLYAENIVAFLMRVPSTNVVLFVKILSVHSLIVMLNIPAYQTLLAFNLQRYTSKIFNTVAVLNILYTPVLCYTMGALGASLSTLITQLIVTVALHLLLEIKFKQYSLFKPRYT